MFETFVAENDCSVVFDLGITLVDNVQGDRIALFERLISRVSDYSSASDLARLSLLAQLKSRYGTCLLSKGFLGESRPMLHVAQQTFKECGNSSGLLDIKFLTILSDMFVNPQRVSGLSSLNGDAELAKLLLQAREAKHYQLQHSILQLQEKHLNFAKSHQTRIDFAYLWKDFCSESGHVMSAQWLIVIAQHEVTLTDDIYEVLGYCDEIENRAELKQNEDLAKNILMIRTLAYARLQNSNRVIECGNQLLEAIIIDGTAAEPISREILLVTLQGYLQRLRQATLSSYLTHLTSLTDWVTGHLRRLDLEREKHIRSQVALTASISLLRMYVLKFDPCRPSYKALLSPTLSAASHYVQLVTTIPDGKETEWLSTKGEFLVLENRFEEAIDLVTHAFEGNRFMHSGDLEGNLAYLQHAVGSWKIRQTEMCSEDAKWEVIASAIADLSSAISYWTSKVERSGRTTDLSMLISSYYFLASAFELQGRYCYHPEDGEGAKESFFHSYMSYLRSIELVDGLHNVAHGQPLGAFLSQDRLLAHGKTSISHLLSGTCKVAPNEDVWHLVQWAKGQSLPHMLASAFNLSDLPSQESEEIPSSQPDRASEKPEFQSQALVKGILALQKKIHKSRYPERLALKERLEGIKQQFSEYPDFKASLRIASAVPASVDDMIWASTMGSPGRNITFVDFFNAGGTIYVCYVRVERRTSMGSPLQAEPGLVTGNAANGAFRYSGWTSPIRITGLSTDDVAGWKRLSLQKENLLPEDFIDKLAELKPLIKPLLENSEEGALLVISPDSLMSSIPLHAIPIDACDSSVGGTVLIERNPIVYTPSMAVLRQCVARAHIRGVDPSTGCDNATFSGYFGSSSSIERPAQDDEIQRLARIVSATAASGRQVDKSHIKFNASISRNIFHFHGHQRNEDGHLSERYLELAPSLLVTDAGHERLTVRDLSKLKFPDDSSPLVTLMTMEPATTSRRTSCVTSEGEESDDLITSTEPTELDPRSGGIPLAPLFLSAGASSVLTTLWSTENSKSASSMIFSRLFYEAYKEMEDDEGEDVIDLARAVQRAVREMRALEPRMNPWQWAGFVLVGSWYRKKRGRSCQ